MFDLAYVCPLWCIFFFFFNDTATTEIYTLSLHDALPICLQEQRGLESTAARRPRGNGAGAIPGTWAIREIRALDRKSTRLNSSHLVISYAVFCLTKKRKMSRADLPRG